MKIVNDAVISVDEAKAALRCMRLCNLDEYEALESLDSLVERVRKIGMADLVTDIIETKLTENQRIIVQEFWFSGKNTSQIARELGVSQANVYRTLSRANDSIKELLTPLVAYFSDLPQTQVAPIIVNEIMKISSAKSRNSEALPDILMNIRLSKAVSPECAARATNVSVRELEKIENGQVEPSIGFLQRFSRAFNVELDMSIVKGKERYGWKEVLQN